MKRGIEGHQYWSKLRRLGSNKDEQRFQVGTFDAGGSAASTAAPVSATVAAGRVSTVSDFISSFDEAAKRRLSSMNEKLRGLEMQMQTFETEMHKANDSSTTWS